jgi:hypothetical protein
VRAFGDAAFAGHKSDPLVFYALRRPYRLMPNPGQGLDIHIRPGLRSAQHFLLKAVEKSLTSLV